ncbi:MAG: Periplasmic thiol:disulfide interchange protein DsbA [Candidatus Binatus sp.]|jgi:protein-disulfide isomerase|nr:Periplasmic thiol:disulfide interchange protein DsbA [Candidatus Binatus sp.]
MFITPNYSERRRSDCSERPRSLFATKLGAAIFAAAMLTTVTIPVPANADDPGKVVATVGDHKITEQDLDAKVKPQIEQMRAMLAKRVEDMIRDKSFDLKRKTLEAMTDDYLLEEAAKKQKLSVDDYIKKEYTGKDKVTDAYAKDWYDKNKGGNTAPFDQIKPQVVAYLNRQALLDRLHKAEPVKIMLEPKRVVVDSSGHPSSGAKDAPVTIVEFTDFQCPFCKSTQATVKQLREKYGDKIRLVHMDFPLSFHSHAMDAANAARCANDQDKFWQYRDALFANTAKLAPSDLKATAKTLGLNQAQFDSCLDKAKYSAEIKKDMAAGEKLGVDGTPAFFIDGRPLIGAQPLPQFESLINEELAAKGGGERQASAK